MEIWIVAVWPRAVAIGGKGRIFVVFSLARIAVRLPLQARLDVIFHSSPAPEPFIFERRRKVQLAGVDNAV